MHRGTLTSRTWKPPILYWDQLGALIILPPILLILMALMPVALVSQGRPFFYRSKRMCSPTRTFRLWKIRTMAEPFHSQDGAAGGDTSDRVLPFGRFLRRTRLDELPQIFNVIAGDIRFLGPRPPLPRYVREYPELYENVLSVPPGVTGLATVMVHRRESRLLSGCATAAETDEVYRRACIPLKARLDILYRDKKCFGLDCWILLRTAACWLPRPRRRSRRRFLRWPSSLRPLIWQVGRITYPSRSALEK